MKATSIFGGVQVFNILIGIIRSKFVAVLLGPAGMGIMGLLTSTLSIITAATNFGLGTSAVKDIAAAHATQDQQKITATVSVFRKLVWITGLLGLAITLIFSPWWSKLTFGNYDYTLAFALLSLTLLIGQLSSGQAVLLQGMRKIKWMAKGGMIGSVLGLVTTLPLYYFFGVKGIVPGLIVTAFTGLIINYYFAKQIPISKISITFRNAIREGKPMMVLGFMLSLAGFITILNSYIIRIFISNTGTVADVGLFTSGFAIISTYVGMVFSAMGTDYYPRLAGVQQDKVKANDLINQQAIIAILILSPMIAGFLIFIQWIVIVLYSHKFLPIVEMVHFAILGIYFQALSWSMAFLILAKGDSKAFFWNELAANIYLLLFNCLGYYLDGLRGLGISFLLGYVVYLVQIYFFIKTKYHYSINKELVWISSLNIVFGIICFLIYYFTNGWKLYFFGSIVIAINTAFSMYWINKKTHLITAILAKFKK